MAFLIREDEQNAFNHKDMGRYRLEFYKYNDLRLGKVADSKKLD